MHRYLIKTPWWLKRIYPRYTWSVNTNDRVVYLSFDDGPHPVITPWVLDELKKADARASFFCIGRNAQQHPEIMKRIHDEGHMIGNHTWDHLNGWKTPDAIYLENIRRAARLTGVRFFRPPYGRVKRSQAAVLMSPEINYKLIMWDVLSADFDKHFSPLECLDHVKAHTKSGSIVVFHDSEKAFPRLEYVLPRALEYFKEEGYMMEALGEKALKS